MSAPSPAEVDGLLWIGEVDIADAIGLVAGLAEPRWHEHEFRQQRSPDVHGATQTVVLRYRWRHISVVDDDLLGAFAPLLTTVQRIVADHAGTPRVAAGNALVVRLPAGATVGEHTDEGRYLKAVRRVHVPLAVNADCTFTVGGIEHRPRAGDVYLLDNNLPHAAANLGATDRIHLICDWLVDGDRVTTTGRRP